MNLHLEALKKRSSHRANQYFDNSVLMTLFLNTRNPNLDINLEKSMQMKNRKISFAKADRVFDDLVSKNNKPVLKTYSKM